MAAISTTIAAAAVIAGTATAVVAHRRGQEASKRASRAASAQAAASRRAEEARRRQATLEARRRRREVIRNRAMAHATSTQVAENRGVIGSSLFTGAVQSASAQAGSQITDINLGQQTGEEIFSANIAGASAGADLFRAQGQQQQAQGLYSLGTTLVSNAGSLGSIGADLFSPRNPAAGPSYGYGGSHSSSLNRIY